MSFVLLPHDQCVCGAVMRGHKKCEMGEGCPRWEYADGHRFGKGGLKTKMDENPDLKLFLFQKYPSTKVMWEWAWPKGKGKGKGKSDGKGKGKGEDKSDSKKGGKKKAAAIKPLSSVAGFGATVAAGNHWTCDVEKVTEEEILLEEEVNGAAAEGVWAEPAAEEGASVGASSGAAAASSSGSAGGFKKGDGKKGRGVKFWLTTSILL